MDCVRVTVLTQIKFVFILIHLNYLIKKNIHTVNYKLNKDTKPWNNDYLESKIIKYKILYDLYRYNSTSQSVLNNWRKIAPIVDVVNANLSINSLS